MTDEDLWANCIFFEFHADDSAQIIPLSDSLQICFHVVIKRQLLQ